MSLKSCCAHRTASCNRSPRRCSTSGQQQHVMALHQKNNPLRRLQSRRVYAQQSGSNVVVSGLVSAMTESLRLLGVGRQQYQQIAQQTTESQPLSPGDIQGLMDRITADYKQAYFVTGIIDDSIYDQVASMNKAAQTLTHIAAAVDHHSRLEDCMFADPTVRFTGLDLWKRNLQLLVPFLIEPKIELLSIEHIGKHKAGPEQVKAEWTLNTVLSLPWKPVVSIVGSTVYTLNTDANKIVQHVESWNVTAPQALMQIVTPGKM